MDFTRPYFLLLALLIPGLWLAMRKSLADMSPRQRKICVALRAFILLLLVLALAGLRISRINRDLSVAFLVDDSASISDSARKTAEQFVEESLKHRGTHDDVSIIGFAAKPMPWETPSGTRPMTWPARTKKPDAAKTDFNQALTFASAILDPEKVQRIILLSDGNDTEQSQPPTLGKELIVDTVALSNPSQPEVAVEKLLLPRQVAVGQPFDLVAVLQSSIRTPVHLALYENHLLVDTRDLTLETGTTEARFPNRTASANYSTWELQVSAERDTQSENNMASGVVTQQGEPRVLVIDPDPTKLQPFVSALLQEKIRVETRGTDGLPRTIDDLQQYDLLILSDVSALNMAAEQMQLYRHWVQDFGGGFVLTGGERSFGAGGYFRTAIEQILPVRMEHEERLDTPTVGLLLVLDRSGSMAAIVAGQSKMALADQGAVLAMQVLQSRDLFGVDAVDTRVHRVVPIARLGEKAGLEPRILSITSGGGGIYIYTALVEAFQDLRDVDAKVKHVILFADAADAEEKTAGEMSGGASGAGSALDLVSAMQAARITTSVVALGNENDRDTEFLRQVADRGNGRFYLTANALTLPQIFTTETLKVAQSSLIEEPFQAVPAPGAAAAPARKMVEGINWKDSPLLLGYNASKLKPSADLLLATERGDPLFATWRTGLGQTAVFSSDIKARWASEWLNWTGYGKFWAQVVRGLMRSGDRSGVHVQTSEQGDSLKVQMNAIRPDGTFRDDLGVAITGVQESGKTQTVTARHVAPGEYEAEVPLPEKGTLALSVSGTSDSGGGSIQYDFAYSRGIPREYLQLSTTPGFLKDLAARTQGLFNPTPTEVFSRPQVRKIQKRELRDALLSLALLLIPLDIWLRRRTWKT